MKLQQRPLLAVTLAAALWLSACAPKAADSDAADDNVTQQGTLAGASSSASDTTATTHTTMSSSPTSTAEAVATTEEAKPLGTFGLDKVQAYPSRDAELVIADVRVGSHKGFDRAVFEFSGTGLPGYSAGYTPQPLQQASGYPIDVNGNAYIELNIQGTPMNMINPNDALVDVGPMNLASGAIEGITHGGVFEADTQYFIGVDKQRPFSLYVLENPTRVVVDIQH